MENKRSGVLYKLYFLLLIYVSGSIFCTSYLYKQSVIAFFLLTFAIFLVVCRKKGKVFSIEKNKAAVFLVFVLCITVVVVLQQPASISSYIAILLQLLTSMLVTKIIGSNEFKRTYCDIMTLLCAISVVCYVIYLIFPSVSLFFPKIEGISSLDYYFAGLYVFSAARGYGYFVPFYRNCSIFWEPGAFQAFTNIALLFLLQDAPKKLDKKTAFRILLFIISVITTFSTTGYIVLILIVLRYGSILFSNRNISRAVFALAGGLIIVIFVLSKTGLTSFFIQKIVNEFGISKKFISRLGLADLEIFIRYPSSLLGLSFEKYEWLASGTGNSLLQTAITLGLPFTSVLMLMYASFSKKSKSAILMFLILVMLFSTESLIWRPFFLCLAWYGVNTFEKVSYT